MNIIVTCNSCGQKLSAPGTLAGRRVPCPKCKAPLDVPAVAGAPAAPTFPAPAFAVPQVVPENRRQPVQPPPAPAMADDGMLDLGLGAPLAPRPVSFNAKPSKGSLVPIIAIAAVLFLAGGGIGAWLMLTGHAGVGSDRNYLPDDADIVLTVDVNGIISSHVGQKIKSQAAAMLSAVNRSLPPDSKLKPEDVGRITVGVRARGNRGRRRSFQSRDCGSRFSRREQGREKNRRQIPDERQGQFGLLPDRRPDGCGR